MADKETESKKEVKPNFELVEVPTQTAIMTRSNATGEVLSQAEVNVLILNMLSSIMKAVA